MAKVILEAEINVCAAFISPTYEIRSLAKEIIGEQRFVEIFVKASLTTCSLRDVKGLYKKVFSGEIDNFTGISSMYECPKASNLVIDTDILSYDCSLKELAKLWCSITEENMTDNRIKGLANVENINR